MFTLNAPKKLKKIIVESSSAIEGALKNSAMFHRALLKATSEGQLTLLEELGEVRTLASPI